MNINRITRGVYLVYTLLVRHKFKHIGKKTILFAPMQLDGTKNISIGSQTFIGEHSWLCVNEKSQGQGLKIGNEVIIGHYAHIVAYKDVLIEDSVLLADHVFITDSAHKYDDIFMPISKQEIAANKSIVIGMGSWIGENVSVLCASIGKHCVIGANSVVTKNVPDYSIAAGNPAEVIKRYNFETNRWEKVKTIK